MPKGKRKSQGTDRPPSLRGAVVVDEIYGDTRIRAWPRARGPNRNPTNKRWTDWLVGVTYLWKYQPANFQAQLIAATKGTPWMARDPFISTFRGRAWSFTDQHGRTYYPKVVQEQVSLSLDTISQLPQTMLWRGSGLWVPVPAPAGPNLLLQSTGSDEPPEWVEPPEGGGGLTAWYPDAPPESAGPIDDEFQTQGSGTPSGWTLVDHGADTTVNVEPWGLDLFQTGSATNGWGGIYKTLPSSPWTIWGRLSILGENVNITSAALAFWEDPTNAAGDLACAEVVMGGTGPLVRFRRYPAWNGADTNVYAPASPAVGPNTWYYRLRFTSPNYQLDISTDGIGWGRVAGFTLPFTPTAVGPAIKSTSSGATARAIFPFFRSLSTNPGQSAVALGARV